MENNCPIHPETINKLYTHYNSKKRKTVNLLSKISLKKILLHPRIKNYIFLKTHKKFVIGIQKYEDFINKVYKILELKTTLPTDIIKYELMKYI